MNEQELVLRSRMIYDYYNNIYIQYALVKSLYRREFCFLTPYWARNENSLNNVRMLKCHNVQSFQYITRYGLRLFQERRLMNLYYSLATYREGIPDQTMNLQKRDNAAWQQDHWMHMESYDWIIDVDSPSHEEIYYCHHAAKKIKKELEQQGIRHHIRFSGNGFHFFLQRPTNLMRCYDPQAEQNIYKNDRVFAEELKEHISSMVDTKIYDSRRVIKVPFSLAIYQDETYVCTPFESEQEFHQFRLEDHALERFLEKRNLKQIGRWNAAYF